MKIAVTKEVTGDERRVALVPGAVSKLIGEGLEVLIESGAGKGAYLSDRDYEEAGAKVVSDVESLLDNADCLVKVGAPKDREGKNESDMLRGGAVLIGFLNPLSNPELVKHLTERKITALSMEFIPRISRTQGMDALSSQASVAGYKAVLIAANTLGRFFPMLTTAAGTITPARVFIIGAGVAGLQAIATARRLGAVVEAFDIRPAVKEEVESLGVRFVEVKVEEETGGEGGYAKEVSEETKRKEQEVMSEHIMTSDVVITTALIPGKKAPILITKDMVEAMKPGSVIVDLAAEQGGNCELTKAGRETVYKDVKIIGPVNLPSSMPVHASQMYSKNISTLLQYLIKDGKIHLDFDDEIINDACITHNGEIRNKRVMEALNR